MNKVFLTGRLTKDAEVKTLNTGVKLAKFCIAVNRKGKKDEADFFFVQDNNGVTHDRFEVVLEEIEFLSDRRSDSSAPVPTPPSSALPFEI